MGDSITAGYGIGEDRAFPELIQEKLDEEGVGRRGDHVTDLADLAEAEGRADGRVLPTDASS